MKNRILTFIIGVLTGAIIATLGFFMYSKWENNNMNFKMTPPNENGQMHQFNDKQNMEEPPQRPSGDAQMQL